MRIQVLGTGDAFTPELGNSALILWDQGRGFLIDCGYTVFPYLKEKNIADKIDRVFITNRYDAHAGSLTTFLDFKRMKGQKVKFFGVAEHLEYLKTIDPKYENDYESFFEDAAETVVTIPVRTGGITSSAFFNFGLLYSGDTAESLLDTPQAFEAKVILHDVSFDENSSAGNFHAPFASLIKASDHIKRKVWLYNFKKDQPKDVELKVLQNGFAGILKKDQILKF